MKRSELIEQFDKINEVVIEEPKRIKVPRGVPQIKIFNAKTGQVLLTFSDNKLFDLRVLKSFYHLDDALQTKIMTIINQYIATPLDERGVSDELMVFRLSFADDEMHYLSYDKKTDTYVLKGLSSGYRYTSHFTEHMIQDFPQKIKDAIDKGVLIKENY